MGFLGFKNVRKQTKRGNGTIGGYECKGIFNGRIRRYGTCLFRCIKNPDNDQLGIVYVIPKFNIIKKKDFKQISSVYRGTVGNKFSFTMGKKCGN